MEHTNFFLLNLNQNPNIGSHRDNHGAYLEFFAKPKPKTLLLKLACLENHGTYLVFLLDLNPYPNWSLPACRESELRDILIVFAKPKPKP